MAGSDEPEPRTQVSCLIAKPTMSAVLFVQHISLECGQPTVFRSVKSGGCTQTRVTAGLPDLKNQFRKGHLIISALIVALLVFGDFLGIATYPLVARPFSQTA